MIHLVFLALAISAQVECHMSMEEPPARNVMWRMGFNHLPKHADDDYLICTNSPCPPCGDNAHSPSPHPHEGGGKWATGTIARSYSIGQKIQVHINVTKSHGGYLEFNLCPHNKVSKPVKQSCLNQYPLEVVGKRSKKVKISAPYDDSEMLTFELMLPAGISCDQCVLQMSNTAEQFKPQMMMFRNCADIAIKGTSKTSFAGGPSVSVRGGAGAGAFAPQPGFPTRHLVFPARHPGLPTTRGGFPAPQPAFISTRSGFPVPQPGFHNQQPPFPSQQGFQEQKQHRYFSSGHF